MPPPRQPLPPVGHLSLPPSCATADGQVGADDPAFANPTKPVGAVYTEEEAESKRLELGWEVRPDGEHWRRVVPSPLPTSILQARTPLPAPPPPNPSPAGMRTPDQATYVDAVAVAVDCVAAATPEHSLLLSRWMGAARLR
jgi:hypothetical protein